MAWLSSLFSGGLDVGRVNPWGLALMALGIVLVALARPLSSMLPRTRPPKYAVAVKLAGLVVCAGGALLAILG